MFFLGNYLIVLTPEGVSMSKLFYRPQDAVVGDVIPTFFNGEFRLFYLQLWRLPDQPDSGPDWYQIGTTDFVNFHEYGPCHIVGGTGAVIERDGLYHLFYCVFPEGRQVICHATSPDLLHWTQIPAHDFEPDPVYYDVPDWRDPAVFWNEEEGLYWMLIAARSHSPYNRSGCVGLCVSTDLESWTARPPLYAPDLYTSALECADLFQIGDWWYLIYSTYSDRFVTHYRMARSPKGPWLTPAEDTFDGRAFYAAKTASDGQRRYLFGWNPTRTEDLFGWNPPVYAGRDFNTWDWGGNLIVHEIVQNWDGTLGVRLPDSVAARFGQAQPVALQPLLGQWRKTKHGHSISSPQGFAAATVGELPDTCLISAHLRFGPGTRRLGIILRASSGLDQGYTIQVEPDRNRVILKSYPFPDEHGGKMPPTEVEIERPLRLRAGHNYEIKLIVDGTIGELYIDDQVAMSFRMYDLSAGQLAFFVADGKARFGNISIKI